MQSQNNDTPKEDTKNNNTGDKHNTNTEKESAGRDNETTPKK